MDNQLENFIETIGSMAEMAAIIREALIKNGFTRSEAVDIASNFIISMISNAGGNNNGN